MFGPLELQGEEIAQDYLFLIVMSDFLYHTFF
jgi:hypothetical protein